MILKLINRTMVNAMLRSTLTPNSIPKRYVHSDDVEYREHLASNISISKELQCILIKDTRSCVLEQIARNRNIHPP